MNPFEVLETRTDASSEEIKAAYHRLAKQWHPDRFTGEEKARAEEKFRALAEAFTLLKDPVRRAEFLQQNAGSQPPKRTQEPVPERSPEDWAAMAKAAFEEGRLDQARALVHYAIRLDEGKADYHRLLASVLEAAGEDHRVVVKALETAVRLDPKDVESHLRLVGHFQTLGMAARAQRHLQAAQGISPNHPKLRQPAPSSAKAPAPAGTPAKKGGGPAKKGGGPAKAVPPEGLVDQLKGLWGRLTGKG